MTQTDSCMVEKLSHYITLSEDDRILLADLEKEETPYRRGEEIQHRGSEARHLFVAKRGWTYSFRVLQDGRRQIVRIHHPGDILGLGDLALGTASLTLRAAEDAVLCPFPRSALKQIFERSPRLTALLFSVTLREQVALSDTLHVIRMTARERIAFLLLDLRARLCITNRHVTDTFRMPLTQSDIGDAVGLTNVYVSKVMTMLEAEGLIRRTGAMIRLVDPDALRRMCDYTDRYRTLDIGWFPAPVID